MTMLLGMAMVGIVWFLNLGTSTGTADGDAARDIELEYDDDNDE